MTDYYIHLTTENERWDTLATKYYGNCYEIKELIKENSHIPISSIIKPNTKVKIPIIEKQIDNKLPVWKQ